MEKIDKKSYDVHSAWAGGFRVQESYSEIIKLMESCPTNKHEFIELHDPIGRKLLFNVEDIVMVYPTERIPLDS